MRKYLIFNLIAFIPPKMIFNSFSIYTYPFVQVGKMRYYCNTIGRSKKSLNNAIYWNKNWIDGFIHP